MQSTQPQMSPEDAAMAQLIPAMIQNPKLMEQMIEFSQKMPAQ